MRRIDLIPQEARKISPTKWIKGYFLKSRTLRIAAIVLGALLLINMWQATTILRYRISIARGKKNITKLRDKIDDSRNIAAQIKKERKSAEEEIKRIKGKLEVLILKRKEQYAWAKVLEHLSELMPGNLWVNKMHVNKEIVTIEGTTFSNAVVSKFMAQIDESEYFKGTSFNYTEKTKLTDKRVIHFEVTTHVVLEKVMR